ncbi:hypothetical protein N4T20_14470 [Flavobacterium sp. TR2]|nr:hypothetical protein [Flavobacterium sp. TR2]UWY26925.1 hypothetical protein N4T20_14470 [Flavobacterium sp. TR2]
MKTLSNHIQESFAPVKEEQIVIENQIDSKEEEAVNEDESKEKEKPSE